MELFHIRLMPLGALSAVVVSAGSCPCAIAVAAYRRYQANRSASPVLPLTILDAGSPHSRQVTTIAPTRYRPSTRTSPRHPDDHPAPEPPDVAV